MSDDIEEILTEGGASVPSNNKNIKPMNIGMILLVIAALVLLAFWAFGGLGRDTGPDGPAGTTIET